MNRLTSLPEGLLSPLTSLQLLDLSGNLLHEVGSRAFSSQYNLHSLILDGNGIERLRPGSFNGLSVLGSLSLADNALRDELYKNRSSRKIDSRRLFSREYDFGKTFSLTENQFYRKTYFYAIASRSLLLKEWDDANPLVKPKQLPILVRRGIPEALRGEASNHLSMK